VNLDRFDLNLLVAFEALMSERQVTRAAHRLHITQPALSGALARLRTVFNDPLFVQHGKSMTPTMRARELDVPIRSALAQVRQALGRPQFNPETSTLAARIATSDDLELTLMSKVLTRIRKVAPGMRLVIRRVAGVFELPAEELESGALDFAIGPFPRGAHQPGGAIASTPLYVDHLVCVARVGHPHIKRALSAAQFLESSHVVIYYPASGAGIVDQLLVERGEQRRKIAMEVSHFTTAVFAAAQSDLIASVNSRIARHLSVPARVRIFKFPFPAPALNYSLHWHSRHTADPAHAWLRQLIADAAVGR
jgi:DNA-binding transcriptional LysR family regulator